MLKLYLASIWNTDLAVGVLLYPVWIQPKEINLNASLAERFGILVRAKSRNFFYNPPIPSPNFVSKDWKPLAKQLADLSMTPFLTS